MERDNFMATATKEKLSVTIEKPTMDLLIKLAPKLTQSNLKAMRLFGVTDPYDGLLDAFNKGYLAFIAMLGDDPIAAVAIMPKKTQPYEVDGLQEATVWLVTTEEFKKAPSDIAKYSKKVFEAMMEQYRAIDTIIDREDKQAVKYALFLDFEDWGAHYDTVMEKKTLGYFRRERKAGPAEPETIKQEDVA